MRNLIVTGLLAALWQQGTRAIPIGIDRRDVPLARMMSRQASNSTLQWGKCDYAAPEGMECTQFEVPLDWNNQTGQQVTLGIARVRATDNATRIGSLIFNPGGPGGAATSVCSLQASGLGIFSPELASHYDIICPDPRGVGTSNPIQCDPDIWNERVSIFPKNEAAYQLMTDKYRSLGESCLNMSGNLVKYVDTVSVAKDFEAIRQALDDGKLNYLGVSYGSQIGATYAELYPENINRMAIDGILDHTASETYFAVTESETYETVLDRFFVWCAANETCALHGQNVSRVWDDIVTQADTTPIPAPDCLSTSNSSLAGTCYPNVTGEDILLNAEGYLTFKSAPPPFGSGWLRLGQALLDASNGNATSLSSPVVAGTNNTIWQGLIVGCLDWTRFNNFADNTYKMQLLNSTSPHTRSAAHSYTFEAQCAGWPVPATNLQKPLNETAMALTPQILMVNAYYDPATSYTWAQSVKEQVPNGVLLTRNGDGHTSYFLKGEASAAIDAYLVNGTLPAQNTVVQT